MGVLERRRITAISPLSTMPRTISKALPMPQTAQTATDSPPAKAGAQASTASMAGVKAETIEVNAAANSGGTQDASQAGKRKPSLAPEAAASTPACENVHAAIAWNTQAASDQSARKLNTTNQLSA